MQTVKALGRSGAAGSAVPDIPELPDAPPVTGPELRELYRLMTSVRRLDQAAIAWQRQGLLPGYAPLLGQEAAQVGSAFAVDRERDFLFPTYREAGVALTLGVDMVEYMSTHKATWHGGLWDAATHRLAPIQAVVAGSVPHAVGWAHGQRLAAGASGSPGVSGEAHGPAEGLGVAVAYLGDGASSQGDVHEAMNIAAVLGAPVVFFVQNNGWAISVPTERQVAGGSVAARAAGYGMPGLQVDGNDAGAVVTAMRRALAHARAGGGPVVVEALTYRRGPHSTADDPGRYRTLDDERRDAGADPLERLRERLLGEGLADEAFLAECDEAAVAKAEAVREGVLALGPRPGAEMFDLVFAEPTDELTRQKAQWQRESLQQEDSERMDSGHDAEPAAPPHRLSSHTAEPRELSLQQALNLALSELLAEDPAVLVFGEDVGTLGGVFRVTDRLAAEHGSARVFDTPLAESGILGLSIGLAMAGFRPVPEVQFDGFSYPAMNQIVTQLGRLHYRSRGAFQVPVTLRVPSFGGIRAPENHGESLEAVFAHVPGLKVVCPADPQEGYTLLKAAVRMPDPVIFMEPKSRYWQKGPVVTEASPGARWSGAQVAREGRLSSAPRGDDSPWGARVARVGRHLTLVAWGAMVARCLQVAELAAEDGVEIEVVDLRWLKPIDTETLAASVAKTRRAVVVHEAPLTAGLGAEVAQRITERCFGTLKAPVERVTGFDVPYPSGDLEDEYIPSIDRILLGIQRVLEYRRG